MEDGLTPDALPPAAVEAATDAAGEETSPCWCDETPVTEAEYRTMAIAILAAALPALRAQWEGERAFMEAEIKSLRVDPDGDDSESHRDLVGLSLTWIAGPELEAEWDKEFWDWYKPSQWLGPHRALNTFLHGKLTELRHEIAALRAPTTSYPLSPEAQLSTDSLSEPTAPSGEAP